MRQNRKNWSSEEDETIMSLVRKYGTKRWTLISQKMKERFPDEGRSGKQCRQRWHNHLSPIINKQPWSQQQIKLVFDSHRRFGNKWTEIAQLLSGRTDNAVKNQFYSTLRKGLRRICKILGTRNSTTRIKKIKPTALSNLISNFTEIPVQKGGNEQELYDMLFEFSNGDKYEQLKQRQVNDKYKQKLEKLLQKILDSKDYGRKKRNRFNSKQCNNQRNITGKQQIQQQNQQDEKFDFNIELNNEKDEHEHGGYMDEEMQAESNLQINFCPHNDQFDSRLDRPISLKKENSLVESIKDEEYLVLKKKSSENDKIGKRHNQMYAQNNQNVLKYFLSKSPNFSSRIKMPTPRTGQGHHLFGFSGCAQDDQPQKCLNYIVQELRSKVDAHSRLEKQRIR